MDSRNMQLQMKAWQYSTTTGGLDGNLHINYSANIPEAKADCHLVRVHATSLNPVDYKLCEVGLLNRFAIKKPASPGLDVVGQIIKPAADSGLNVGQIVVGNPVPAALMAGGGLAEYVNLFAQASTPTPTGITTAEAAALPVAGLTAWQTIVPFVKTGARIFVNGGSGGVGIFAIQIAKMHGCHVTCSCSGANVELCKSLGADDVIDYRKNSVLDALKAYAKDGKPYDHVADYVGADYDLFWKCHEYTLPTARYISIAATPSLNYALFALKANFLPEFLGGARRKMVQLYAQQNKDQLAHVAKLVADGKLRVVIDQEYSFEQAVEAIRRLKTGRARGKIIVRGTCEEVIAK